MSEEFKEFNIIFTKFGGHSDLCECDSCNKRLMARWVIRGCLMFNDLPLADDPWNYENPKNR
jgi:hypothetical protein